MRWWGNGAAAVILLLARAASAAGADWRGRFLQTVNGGKADSTWSGQNRQYLEVGARGPVFLENQGVLTLILERFTALEGGPDIFRPLTRLDLSGGLYSLQVRHRPSQPASLANEETSVRETQVILSLTPPSLPIVRFQSFTGRREGDQGQGRRLLSDRRLDITHLVGGLRASAGIRRTRREETETGEIFTVDEQRAEVGFRPSLPSVVRASVDGGFIRDVSHREALGKLESRVFTYTASGGVIPRRTLDVSGQYSGRITGTRTTGEGGFDHTGEQTIVGRLSWRPLVPTTFLVERESRLPVGDGTRFDVARIQAILEGNVRPQVHMRAQYLRTLLVSDVGSPGHWWTLTTDAPVARGVWARSDLWLMTDGGIGAQTREQWEVRTRPTPFLRFDSVARIERRGASIGGLRPSLLSLRWEGQYLPPRGPRPTLQWEDRLDVEQDRRERLILANLDLTSRGGSAVSLILNRTTARGGRLPASRLTSAGVRGDIRFVRGTVLSGSYFVTWRSGLATQRNFSAGLEWRF